MRFLITIVFLITGCQSGLQNSSTSFANVHLNSINVTKSDDHFSAKAKNGICSNVNFGVGNDENGCITGTKISMLTEVGGGVFGGQSMEYGFKFYVVPFEAWDYAGKEVVGIEKFTKDPRFYMDSRIELAVWQRMNAAKAVNLILKVHPKIGVIMLDKVCAPPEKFGTWVDFKLSTNFSKNGFLYAECNGVKFIDEKNIDTSINPFCYIQNDCTVEQHAKNIHMPIKMQVGLRVKGVGTGIGRPNIPLPLPKEGLEIRLKDIYTKRL